MTSSLEAPPQVAIDDLGSPEAFLAAIDATIKYFNDGDIVTGTVVKVDRDEVLLDIGYKTEGVIPSKELSIKHDVDPFDVVSVGDEIEALVQQKEDKEGRLILSKKRAQYERAWGTIEKIKEEDGVVTGHVIEVVKGGLIIDIGLRGFLPASLVEMRRVRDLQPYVGMELEAKIIELDKNRNNVVLSRRAWLEQTQSEVRQSFLTQLQAGQIRKGVVSSIVNFGAFVDLGGVDGLVHVSELSWKHIDHPSEVVEVGQEVTVEVLERRAGSRAGLPVAQGDPGRSVAGLRPDPPDRSDRARQGHQAGAVRCVRPRRGGHRGSGARLRAGRASRGDPRAGRPGQRRCHGQDHRHRSGAPPDLAVAEAGQRGCRRDGRRLRPDAVRHGRLLRRPGQLPLPGGLRPGDGRVARGLRGAARGLGAAVRRGARPLGSAQEAGRGRREWREPPRQLRPSYSSERRDASVPTPDGTRRLAGLRRGAAGAAARSSPAAAEPGTATLTAALRTTPRWAGASLIPGSFPASCGATQAASA